MLFACSEEPLGLERNVRETPLSEAIWPLLLSIEWLYRVQHFDAHARLTGETQSSNAIVALHVLDGKNWYRYLNAVDDESEVLLHQQDDGIWTRDEEGVMRPAFLFPLQAGDSYTLPAETNPGHMIVRRVVAVDAAVTINGTSLTAVHYRDDLLTTNGRELLTPFRDWYFARGYGPLRIVQYDSTAEGDEYPWRVAELLRISQP